MPMMIATGPCFTHGELFDFDPDRVQTVLIDPVTGRPPDLAEDGTPVPAGDPGLAERNARSVQRFVCPACCKAMNLLAVTMGIPAVWDETDTAEVPR